MKLWQIASGDTGRDYSDLFLEYDIMLIGPGSRGPFERGRYTGVRMAKQIDWFVHKPSPGDLVLLRNGHEVRAVGRIPTDIVSHAHYHWNALFDDVLGWDLQHTRPVVWSTKAVQVLRPEKPVFGDRYQQHTFHEVHEVRLKRFLPELDEKIEDRDRRDPPNWQFPAEVPEEFKLLDEEELGVELFAAGLSNDSVEQVLRAIERIRRLRQWYREHGESNRPSETEAVSHMIIPLMFGLGWSEQLLAVEWKRIDLALFDRIPTDKSSCIAVLEAKSPGKGLNKAYLQAKTYVDRHELKHCQKIIATDGALLLIYHRTRDKWPEKPNGYVNLGKIRRNNVYPTGATGVEALIGLMPSRIHH